MNGHHLTRPRSRVLSVIRGSQGKHLSAEEIAAAVNRRRPAIHLATIYRALQYLTRQGLVKRCSFNENHAHYEASRNAGVHLVCNSCGAVREIDDRQSQKLFTTLGQSLRGSFEVKAWQMELAGTCRRCAQRQGRPASGGRR